MKTVDTFNFTNRKALIRVDFNVPLNDKYEITDDTRLKAVIPTVNKILNDGGSVVLMSHLGRPKGGPEEKFSLKHLIPYLNKAFDTQIKFATDCIGQDALDLSSSLKPKEILLLENLRFYKEEEKGDEAFAEKLSKLGDVWVNDAFGTAHRAHGSTAVIGKFFKDKVCGYVMEAEIKNANKVLEHGEKPVTAVMGGAKISDKIQVIERLLGQVNNLIIGGGMSYTFVKAEGGNVGNSICENDKLDLAKEIVKKAKAKGVKLFFPIDNLIADKFDNNANTQIVGYGEIPDGWEGLDIGPKTVKLFSDVIAESKTILPLGSWIKKKLPNNH